MRRGTSAYDVRFFIRTPQFYIKRVPALRAFWDLEKTVLHEIRVSGTVGGPLVVNFSEEGLNNISKRGISKPTLSYLF